MRIGQIDLALNEIDPATLVADLSLHVGFMTAPMMPRGHRPDMHSIPDELVASTRTTWLRARMHVDCVANHGRWPMRRTLKGRCGRSAATLPPAPCH
jgi:hypothetical protein